MNPLLQQPTNEKMTCYRCQTAYDARQASWCACERIARSLICPACRSCFCEAPVPYRRAYWSTVPAEVRQDPRRFAAGGSGLPAAVTVREASPTAPVIVIADDDEALRSLVACYVESLGYRTRVTGNAREALDLAQAREVRVLITDAFMPQMDGRELCRELKRTRHGALKKVIVITSLYTARRFREEAFRQFAVDEYLCKPLNLTSLARLLQRFAPLPVALKPDGCPDSEQLILSPRVA
jgi:CheY-like chemotaxis protein